MGGTGVFAFTRVPSSEDDEDDGHDYPRNIFEINTIDGPPPLVDEVIVSLNGYQKQIHQIPRRRKDHCHLTKFFLVTMPVMWQNFVQIMGDESSSDGSDEGEHSIADWPVARAGNRAIVCAAISHS